MAEQEYNKGKQPEKETGNGNPESKVATNPSGLLEIGNNPIPDGSLGFVSTTPIHNLQTSSGVFLYGCKVYRIPDGPIKTQLPDTENNPTSEQISYPENLCNDYAVFPGTADPKNWIILHKFESCGGDGPDVDDDMEKFKEMLNKRRFAVSDGQPLSSKSLFYAECCESDDPFSLKVGDKYSGLKVSSTGFEYTQKFVYLGMEYNPNFNQDSLCTYCNVQEEDDCEESTVVLGGALTGRSWVDGKTRVTGKSNGTQSTVQAKEYSVNLVGESTIKSASSLVDDVQVTFSEKTVNGVCTSEDGYFEMDNNELQLFEVEFQDPNDELYEINPGGSYIMDNQNALLDLSSVGIIDNVCFNLCQRRDEIEIQLKQLTKEEEELTATRDKINEQIKGVQQDIAELDPPCDCANPSTDQCAALCEQLAAYIAALEVVESQLNEVKEQKDKIENEDAVLGEQIAANCPGGCNPAA